MNFADSFPTSPARPERTDDSGAGPGSLATDLPPAQRLLEARLVRLERHLGFRPLTDADAAIILGGEARAAPSAPTGESELEMEIGEYWLARVGVIALSVGLAFLVAYPFQGLPAFVSCLIGYAAAAGFFAAAHRWRRALSETAQILFGGALFLLYFATLRLHSFSLHPVVADRPISLAVLVAVLGGEFFLTARRRSEVLTGLVFGLGFTTALLAESSGAEFGLMVGLAVTAYGLVRWRNWPGLGLVVTGLAYFVHLDWLLNHPLLGHALHGVEAAQGNLMALAAYSAPLVALGCRPGAERDHLALRIGRALLIGGGAMLIALINVQLFYAAAPPWVETGVAAGLLLAAVVHWRHHQSVYATSLYACAGYLMLSAAIFRYFPAPDFYAWLAWQSLLVAVTAVWFRSKIVIVANVFIFGGIYFAHLLTGTGTGPVNLSFAVVALLTARVLNWQKDRLDLRTEFMRNLYLIAASVVIPYGLFHTVPGAWVSVSWLGAAGVYFIASAVLRSQKYRLMGIGTILATIVYVFVVDLARLEPAYRIMSFLVLGAVLLGISIAYARRRRQRLP